MCTSKLYVSTEYPTVGNSDEITNKDIQENVKHKSKLLKIEEIVIIIIMKIFSKLVILSTLYAICVLRSKLCAEFNHYGYKQHICESSMAATHQFPFNSLCCQVSVENFERNSLVVLILYRTMFPHFITLSFEYEIDHNPVITIL